MIRRSRTHTFFYTMVLFSALTAQAQTGGGWKKVDSPRGANYNGIQFVYFFNKNDGVVAGDSGFIRYTRNGGAPWQQPVIKSSTDSPLQVTDDFYKGMKAGDTFFLLGVQYLLYSKDKGKSWHEAASPQTAKDLGITWVRESFYADVFFVDEDEGWLLGVVPKGQGKFMNFILHTNNRGTNWETYASLRTNKKMKKMFFVNKDIGWMVGDSGTILKSYDGGRNWNKLEREPQWRLKKRKSRAPGDLPNLLDITFSDKGVGIIVGKEGTILRMTDSRYWYQVDPPRLPSGREDDTNLLNVEFVEDRHDQSYWWIIGYKDEILCTADGGKSWRRQSLPVPFPMFSIYMLNPDLGWAGGEKKTLLRYRGDKDSRCGFDDRER